MIMMTMTAMMTTRISVLRRDHACEAGMKLLTMEYSPYHFMQCYVCHQGNVHLFNQY